MDDILRPHAEVRDDEPDTGEERRRILDSEKVADSKKVLSLYEPDVHVIFRGKSGAEVEFGNTLYIAESRDGLIVDFEYCRLLTPVFPILLYRSRSDDEMVSSTAQE
jgi:hypothetical protein